MARHNRVSFELKVGSLAKSDLEVVSFKGEEALSTPFAFEVEFFPKSEEPIALHDLVATKACLTLSRPGGATRHVHGVCAGVELRGVYAGRPRYKLRLVPRLRLLGHTARSKVFQKKSAPEIVKAVLDAGEVKVRDALSGSYEKRAYCVQHAESDLDFASRLLASEGIAYYFEHTEDAETLVLCDAPSDFPDLAEGTELPYRLETGQWSDEEFLSRLSLTKALRPGAVALRDFDFERPSTDLETESSASDGDAELEVHDYPGEYLSTSEGRRLSKALLQELRFGADTAEGASTCQRLIPGCLFESTGHPDDAFNRKLLAVRVEHEGKRQASVGDAGAIEDGYSNRFLAIESGKPYRPRHRARRARIEGPETATVVGASGEEITTEERGRVKIQFHWDRDGQDDESSSCWVRVMQRWAGAGWGASFIPRIGQEVLVRFLEGNPDRPLVIGALYNGQNTPPISLPDDKTQSTLRTASSPGSGGSNELRFEDAAGAEELFLHAEKDQDVEVLNDASERVIGSQSRKVEGDASTTVEGNQVQRVWLDDAAKIDGSQTLDVSGSRLVSVTGSHTEKVLGDQSETVSEARKLRVGGTAVETVIKDATVEVEKALDLHVLGLCNLAVVGDRKLEIEKDHMVRAQSWEGLVVKDYSLEVKGDDQRHVEGAKELEVGGDAKEEVDGERGEDVAELAAWQAKSIEVKVDALNLVVGDKLALSIGKSGDVGLAGKTITVDASTLALKGSSKVEKESEGSADSKSAKVSEIETKEKKTYFAEFTLTDQDGEVIGGEPFHLELPDGEAVRGVTDAAGKAKVASAKSGKFKLRFPRLDHQSIETK